MVPMHTAPQPRTGDLVALSSPRWIRQPAADFFGAVGPAKIAPAGAVGTLDLSDGDGHTVVFPGGFLATGLHDADLSLAAV